MQSASAFIRSRALCPCAISQQAVRRYVPRLVQPARTSQHQNDGKQTRQCPPAVSSAAAAPTPPPSLSTNNRLPTMSPLGQIAPHTHPHLFKSSHELTPGITAEEYESRRTKLVTNPDIPNKATIIVAGHGLRYMTNGIFYPFHQNTDLLYLTGIAEPDVVLLLNKDSSCSRGYKMTIFLKPRDTRSERWDGTRTGLEGAREYFGADHASPIHELPAALQDIFNGQNPIVTDLDISALEDKSSILQGASISTSISSHAVSSRESSPSISALSSFFSRRKQPLATSSRIYKLGPYLRELRLIKSDAEIALMREAGRITGRAFQNAMARTKPGLTEGWLHARLEYDVKKRGAWGLCYVPVVASGSNALTIHYVRNTDVMKDGDLVLLDAGCEYYGMCSDVTRTFPVNGRFSAAQRALYNVVLKTQKACIERCTEMARASLDDIHSSAMNVLRKECENLFSRTVTKEETRALLAHHIGHYLGMDVHDTDDVPRDRRLVRGMVVTIEPGLYIPNDPHQYPPELCGTGIRIEDNVVVGERDYVVLSAEAPKEIVDIEAIMSGMIQPHL
ncbi:hypothetical protein SeMB42_g07564 [Synchytrium endobioticum]|uniref:Aminopeptidase P N-terminal domain-containing protein n=1 Tax=Synchytrium endobioticum TaxID=286115 RepID=A0A507BVM0_9FUNG|nr:hypothetical protein SeMB42_g07564 [Synchytrium endobioticum]TPX46127.1 hypothetical protein SeLEV6574_g03401 [Synchytrium endobioticum]